MSVDRKASLPTRWLPLESSPEIFSEFARRLGMCPQMSFADVLAFEPDCNGFAAQSVQAVILLFPIGDERIVENHSWSGPLPFFVHQTVENACGAVALVHVLLNCPSMLVRDGIGHRYLEETKDLSAAERGKVLEEFDDIAAIHAELAQQGQTAPPSLDDDAELHFISFVPLSNGIAQLDGRQQSFTVHPWPSERPFFEEACDIIKSNFIKQSPEAVSFSAMALVANATEE